MSFGWSVGDLVQAASLAWSVYESFGGGVRSARNEFKAFQAEFSLIKVALERLDGIASTASEVDLELGPSYQQTLVRCAEFIRKHETLTQGVSKGTDGRRPSFQARISSLWDQVAWPIEREKAEALRRQLERYVQIAILKITANTRDVTRQLLRATDQTRADHLEMLKAIKTMSVQVSSILKRCLPDGSMDESDIDVQYLAGLQRRHVASLLDPWPGLGAIPENDVMSRSDTLVSESSQEALDRIQEITGKLGHIIMRTDNPGGRTAEEKRRYVMPPPSPTHRHGMGTTTVAPVVGLLHQISEEIREALDKVGYEHVSVPGQKSPNAYNEATKPTKVLSNAVGEWEQFHEWLQFQLVHSLEVNPGHPDLISEPLRRQSAEGLPEVGASSPPRSATGRALSPRQLPIIVDQTTQMTRTPSSESYYLGSRPPSSIGSLSDRRSSVQPVQLTRQPVQVVFPDPKHLNRQMYRPMTCHVVVYFSLRGSEPQWIESTDSEHGTKLTHSLDLDHPSKSAETSFTPYVSHSRYPGAVRSSLAIQFLGSHRTTIERNSSVKRCYVPPIYICQDKEDFEMFQNVLMRRQLVFCGNVKRVHSSSIGDHCSLETVRAFKDRLTGSTSILYFASNRGSNTLPGFIEWPVSDFDSPRKAGKRDVKLTLIREAIQRRNSIESTSTSHSHESRTSGFSWTESSWKVKSLQFDFEQATEAEAFIKALKS